MVFSPGEHYSNNRLATVKRACWGRPSIPAIPGTLETGFDHLRYPVGQRGSRGMLPWHTRQRTTSPAGSRDNRPEGHQELRVIPPRSSTFAKAGGYGFTPARPWARLVRRLMNLSAINRPGLDSLSRSLSVHQEK